MMHRRLYVVLMTAFAGLILGSLYWFLKPTIDKDDLGRARSHLYRLSISPPLPGEKSLVFEAVSGDQITLVIASDRPGQVYLHGYEKKIDLKPGGEVTMKFVAKDAGLFPLHLHELLDRSKPDALVSHRHLATLEVQLP